MKLKFVRTQLFSKTAGFSAVIFCLCFGTIIVSAQTNYNFTFPCDASVPEGNLSGLTLNKYLTGMGGTIASLAVSLDITGGFNGDLYAYLDGPAGFVVLLNRPGLTAGNSFGYDDSGFNVTFTTSAAGNIHFYQDQTYNLNGSGQLTGTWQPDGRAIDPQSSPSLFDTTSPSALLNSFDGTNPNGSWTLFVADLSSGGDSQLVNWGLEITTIPEPPAFTLLALSGGLMAFWRYSRRLGSTGTPDPNPHFQMRVPGRRYKSVPAGRLNPPRYPLTKSKNSSLARPPSQR
jgi:subtilisin-like proprotein convertase family protein